jgi:hypothetical protein
MEIRNMENMNGRTKKQGREEPDRETEAEGRRKAWDWELMKYYCHKKAAVSLNDLKRFERLLHSALSKQPGRRGGDEQT